MISWSSEDKNQDNLNRIAQWWNSLGGKLVQRTRRLGTSTDATGKITEHGGLLSTFIIQSPTLLHESLSYRNSEASWTHEVEQLQLDVQTQCLRVTTASNEFYTFQVK